MRQKADSLTLTPDTGLGDFTRRYGCARVLQVDAHQAVAVRISLGNAFGKEKPTEINASKRGADSRGACSGCLPSPPSLQQCLLFHVRSHDGFGPLKSISASLLVACTPRLLFSQHGQRHQHHDQGRHQGQAAPPPPHVPRGWSHIYIYVLSSGTPEGQKKIS